MTKTLVVGDQKREAMSVAAALIMMRRKRKKPEDDVVSVGETSDISYKKKTLHENHNNIVLYQN